MTRYKGFEIDGAKITKIIYGNDVYLINDSYTYYITKDDTIYCTKKPIKSVLQAKNIITRILRGKYYG